MRCIYGLVLPRTTAAFLSESTIRLFTFVHTLFSIYLFSCDEKKVEKKKSYRYKRTRLHFIFLWEAFHSFKKTRHLCEQNTPNTTIDEAILRSYSLNLGFLIEIFRITFGWSYHSLGLLTKKKIFCAWKIRRLVQASIEFDNHNILSRIEFVPFD